MSRKDAIFNLRQVLVKRREALRKALAGELSLLKELRAEFEGPADSELDQIQDEISAQLAEVEARELASVVDALDRMAKGEFGICQDCKTTIPMPRLAALPCAIRCIKCQREWERRGMVAPDPPKGDIQFPTDSDF